ncbi:MAG: hypothetical protein LBM93_12925, partial [Oscillospiraceae bacterium]|nr:hypothetical protein [Oscillospiraceae bacterium]
MEADKLSINEIKKKNKDLKIDDFTDQIIKYVYDQNSLNTEVNAICFVRYAESHILYNRIRTYERKEYDLDKYFFKKLEDYFLSKDNLYSLKNYEILNENLYPTGDCSKRYYDNFKEYGTYDEIKKIFILKNIPNIFSVVNSCHTLTFKCYFSFIGSDGKITKINEKKMIDFIIDKFSLSLSRDKKRKFY